MALTNSTENISITPHTSKTEVLRMFRDGNIEFYPELLKIVDVSLQSSDGSQTDSTIKVRWGKFVASFWIEYQAVTTPKIFTETILKLQHIRQSINHPPLLVSPYFSDDQLKRLFELQISGIDLCGNGILLGNNFNIWRSGQPNKFKRGWESGGSLSTRPIRHIYRGTSSLFVRCLLLRSYYTSLSELIAYAGSRRMVTSDAKIGRALTKGTASKVISTLKNDLLVINEGSILRLADAVSLMRNLLRDYSLPTERKIQGKSSFDPLNIWNKLHNIRTSDPLFRYIATGTGSATYYNLLSGPNKLSIYVSDISVASEVLNIQQSLVFPNIELLETDSEIPYFDARLEGNSAWASPVQTWLELASGGPRERSAAAVLAERLSKGEGELIYGQGEGIR